MPEIKKKRPLQFSLLAALIAMLIIGVGSGYYGKLVRDRSRAEARHKEAEAELARKAEKLDEQRTTTWYLISNEHRRIISEQPSPNSAVGGTDSQYGRASWQSKITMSLPATPNEKLAAITVSAKITEDRKLTSIKIKSDGGTEDESIILHLEEEYDSQGWTYEVVSADVDSEFTHDTPVLEK